MTDHTNPAGAAWHLLNAAAQLYRDDPRGTAWLHAGLARFAEPLRIAVTGGPGTGRSTLVNALAGELIAPIEVGDGTGVCAWYRDGAEPAATVFGPGGPQPVPVARRDRRLLLDLGLWRPEQVERVVVDWPARGLRDLTLIDTPATIDPRWLATQVDAIVHLGRTADDADLEPLRAMRDAAGGMASPVTTVLALSRADELGGGRIDALTSAKQIARRRRADAGVFSLCQNVIAVAGLVGQAGRTLSDHEFAALRTLAALPRSDVDGHLLSADRFAAPDLPVRLPAEDRVALLDRFGVFGIRLASTLIRRGADTMAALAGQLVQRSGVSELRESIGQYFLDRADALRARSALVVLDAVIRGDPRPAARKLAADAERIMAGAHDERESRLLAALRAGRLTLPGGLDQVAERVLGGLGTGVADRLGFAEEPSDMDARAAAFEELARWRAQAESPLLGAEQRAAAGVVTRTCEGLIADFAELADRSVSPHG